MHLSTGLNHMASFNAFEYWAESHDHLSTGLNHMTRAEPHMWSVSMHF